jgi:phosphoglycerate dehydrogenase-like enzyme
MDSSFSSKAGTLADTSAMDSQGLPVTPNVPPRLEKSETALLGRTPVKTAFMAPPQNRELVFSPQMLAEVERLSGSPTVWLDPENLNDHAADLAEVEVLFGTWGMPKMDSTFLAKAPKLKALFYAAGSVKSFVTPQVFDRGILVCAAASANAIPVAEFSFAAIIMSLKQVWRLHREMPRTREFVQPVEKMAGVYQSTVGLVSLGVIAQKLAEFLRSLDVRVLAYDPFIDPEVAADLGMELCSLERLFEESDVISLHTPWLPETENLINRALLQRMKPHATLINTARGKIIREVDLYKVLGERPDLTAVLDVTYPEPPLPDSPLWSLPNVFLTPHIAGSIGHECWRMGDYMLHEFRRHRTGKPLLHSISQEQLARMA